MELNTRNMDTIRLLGSQEKIHGMVESGFSGERKRNPAADMQKAVESYLGV